jgi:hypothetical protein
MRLLFFIFVLLNAAAFGYVRYAENRAGAENQLALLQIAPDKMKLQKSGVSARKDAGRSQPGLVCLEWGGFAGDDGPRAALALGRLGLGDKVSQRDTGDSFWVYIPPMKTQAEADKKVSELKARGVADFYLMQDNDQWRYAISLGVFKTEDAANNYLAQLRQKNVRSAVSSPRGTKSTLFVIRDPGDVAAARIAEMKIDFPGVQLRATSCADAATAKN